MAQLAKFRNAMSGSRGFEFEPGAAQMHGEIDRKSGFNSIARIGPLAS